MSKHGVRLAKGLHRPCKWYPAIGAQHSRLQASLARGKVCAARATSSDRHTSATVRAGRLRSPVAAVREDGRASLSCAGSERHTIPMLPGAPLSICRGRPCRIRVRAASSAAGGPSLRQVHIGRTKRVIAQPPGSRTRQQRVTSNVLRISYTATPERRQQRAYRSPPRGPPMGGPHPPTPRERG